MLGDGKRILLVEDEASVRVTLSANFELMGFEVVEAESAQRALQILEQRSVDLVLSDVRMPGLSGLELHERIKATYPGLPVVLMTAFTTQSDLDKAMVDGVFTVLSKPFDIDVVSQVLARAMRHPAVLVVQDLTNDAALMVQALSVAGLRVQRVEDAEGAVTAVRDGEVDICLTALQATGADELVIQRIREANKGITLIVLMSDELPDLIRRLGASSAYACLRHPVDGAELLKTIARARAQPPVGGPP